MRFFDDIRPLAERCFEEFKYPGSLDYDAFMSHWRTAIGSGMGDILARWEPGGQPVGILGYVMTTDQFNGWKTCMANFWFVLPEYRKRGHGPALFKLMESTARQEGCKRILMGHPPGHEIFFRKRGFEPIEVGFHKLL